MNIIGQIYIKEDYENKFIATTKDELLDINE